MAAVVVDNVTTGNPRRCYRDKDTRAPIRRSLSAEECSCGCDLRLFSLCLHIARMGRLYQSDIFLDVLPALEWLEPAYLLFGGGWDFSVGQFSQFLPGPCREESARRKQGVIIVI